MDKFLTEEQFKEITDAIIKEMERAADDAGVSLAYDTLECITEPVRRFVKDKPKTRNSELHGKGLDAAEKFLKMRGYEIIEREWVCDAGEVDFIAEDEGTLVFVEVKTRNMTDKGMPDEAITEEKRKRFENIAANYLARNEHEECAIRFDIIGILVTSEHKALIRHHINAFN